MENAITLAPDQIDLITRTVARGCTKDELALFLHACRTTGLDPLLKQIYAVKRGGSLAIQTGIDGLRLVAERTGKYSPGREPSFTYEGGAADGQFPISATAYIKKMTPDGTWHEVAATARWDEYCPRTPNGMPTAFWQRMPHVMLAKVAESLALRRAFPMELSGIYGADEMSQADEEHAAKQKFPRFRGQQAKLDEPVPMEAAEPADEDGSGESIVEGPVSEEGPDGPGPSEDAMRRKVKLEALINDVADIRRLKPGKLRDEVKQKALDAFGKEHFVDLTPLEAAKLMHWLENGSFA